MKLPDLGTPTIVKHKLPSGMVLHFRKADLGTLSYIGQKKMAGEFEGDVVLEVLSKLLYGYEGSPEEKLLFMKNVEIGHLEDLLVLLSKLDIGAKKNPSITKK